MVTLLITVFRAMPATKPVSRARAIGETQHLDRRLHDGGSDVDDAAEFACHHAVDGCLDQLDRREHVGVQRLDPVVAGPVAEIARWWAAGIVDQDIRLRAGFEHRLPPRGRGDVADHLGHGHARIGLADLARGLGKRFGAARGKGDMHALIGQRDRAGASQPFRGCADDGAAALDSKIHCSLPLTQMISMPAL
jgi:hypothetical protein